MKALIIAGGPGTRLRPLTYNTPKPIVLVANQEFLKHQIEFLRQQGIYEIILNLHYMPQLIERVFSDGAKLGVKIHYSIEKNPLGTAGAVKNAEQFFDDEPLIVFNGDVLTGINLSKMISLHLSKKSKATLALTPVEDPTAYGLVITDKEGRITSFLEKPGWELVQGMPKKEINAGIYILDPSIFKDVPKGTHYMFEHNLFPKLLNESQPMYGYSSDLYWIDIGDLSKYKLVHEHILRGDVAVRIFGARHLEGYWIGDRVDISDSVKIFGSVIIGDRVKIKSGTVVKDYSVVSDSVEIGEHSLLDHSIVWRGCHIGSHVKISDCILGFNCKIEDYCSLNGVVLADNSVVTKGSILA